MIAHSHEDQFCFGCLIDQQEITCQMAFAKALPIANQWMIPELRGQGFACLQQGHGLDETVQIAPCLGGAKNSSFEQKETKISGREASFAPAFHRFIHRYNGEDGLMITEFRLLIFEVRGSKFFLFPSKIQNQQSAISNRQSILHPQFEDF